MFEQKRQAEKVVKITTQNKTSVVTPLFVAAAKKQNNISQSANGAKKYIKTDSEFVNQFSALGEYKTPRKFEKIEKDCELLWGIDKKLCVLFIFYIRMITRTVQFCDGSTTSLPQKGGELKHEGIMRMIWLHHKSPKIFWQNIGLYVAISSWKDIIQMLQFDLVYQSWEKKVLDWDKFKSLILSGLSNPNTSELVKKYLPQIKANSQCKTIEAQTDNQIAKWLCAALFGTKGEDSGWTYKKYRKLKTSGTAHEWQQLISQGKHELLDFSKIHGRALNLLVKSKYLKNHNLEEKYNEWIAKPEVQNVKYTGFVHELFESLPSYISSLEFSRSETINKQFATLVKKAGETEMTELIVTRDTSGSMSSQCIGTKLSCYNVAKALALYFSEFLHGKFSDSWIEFNRTAVMHSWVGNTPVEKWYNDKTDTVGNTNFQTVVDLFCRLKKEGVSELDFPKGILMISDDQLDMSSINETNVESMFRKFNNVGFSKEYIDNFVMIMWNLSNSNNKAKFETYESNFPNIFYFSGFSAATISFVTSKVKNAQELFEKALDQEVLNMIEIY